MEIEKTLVSAIRATYEQSVLQASLARGHGSNAIAAALDCGRLLTKAKAQLKHGEWIPWLEANTPEISQPTAWRYMQFANHAHVNDLEDYPTLRKAYIATGILPEPEPGPAGEPSAPQPLYLSHIQGACQALAKTKVEQLNDTAKAALKAQLMPLHLLWERL